jgi:hypothetical protein
LDDFERRHYPDRILFTARYFLVREIDPDHEFGIACGERYLK